MEAVTANDIHQINQILMLDLEFDNNIEADCIQVHVQDEGTQGELESVEIKQEKQEAMEEDIDENDDSSFNRPKSAWEKVKLIPLITWFIRMLSLGLTKH